ncbi:response regulator [Candidatus Kaiserbacteria bacterium]|nr:response regulator [Candidatus Kaiserbacteria bacterium]
MSKGRILFADDELHYIEALMAVAESEGYAVEMCRNASAAVKRAKEGELSCLVMDIMMDPGSDFPTTSAQNGGLAAIRAILAMPNHPPIICLSVIGDEKIIGMLKRSGVLYLRKGETSLKKAWLVINSKITGIYSVE